MSPLFFLLIRFYALCEFLEIFLSQQQSRLRVLYIRAYFPRDFPGCSVPVLSANKPWFSQGFSHIGPIALTLLPIHGCPCLQVLPPF